MSSKKRYDIHHRSLHVGEYQRKDGRYVYRWTDEFGRRHCVYAKDLDMLRIKEQKIQLNKLEGIREPPAGLTLERLYDVCLNVESRILLMPTMLIHLTPLLGLTLERYL